MIFQEKTGGTRLEKDSAGEEYVEDTKYWGASTERARRLFQVSYQKMPLAVIHALGRIKQAAAFANNNLGLLDQPLAGAIQKAASEVAEGKWDEHFPLSIWQTGSGTATHMNVNEVVANRANELLGKPLGKKFPVHPNDHVNKGQSTNDTFGTAMHVATVRHLYVHLLPALKGVIAWARQKEKEWAGLVKVGRTHMQDATPMTLGQEFGAFRAMLEASEVRIKESLKELSLVAQGGTAVGTGLGAHPDFAARCTQKLSELTGFSFQPHTSPFYMMAMHDALVNVSWQLATLAGGLGKMASDLRLLSSGPRCGLGEVVLPANEPGSSIMPGKVNPTQIESLLMVCVHVEGAAHSVARAGASGQLQLNVMKPLIIGHLLNNIVSLTDGMNNFRTYCLEGIVPNEGRLKHYAETSLMVVTALSKHIGYDRAAAIAKRAVEKDWTLKQAALDLGYMDEEQFDACTDPSTML